MTKRDSLHGHLAGALTARTGDEMAGPALLLAAFALTGSPALASALLAAVTVAAAVGGPVLGALLDRSRRPGHLLAAALFLHALGLTAVLLMLGRAPFTVTFVLAVLTGLPGPALSAGWTARLPVPATLDGRTRATALDAMTFHAASLAGPALAGLTARTLGAPQAVAAAATLVCVGAAQALRLPRPAPLNESGARQDAGHLLARLAVGVRYIRTRPHLAAATLGSVVSSAAQGLLTACVPLLGESVLGGAADGALLLSCTAAAALVANAVLARLTPGPDPGRMLRAGALIQAGATLLAATGRPIAVVASAVLVGLGEGPQLTALFAVRHRETPEELRGRIFTIGASAKVTAFALGAAAAGPLGTWSLSAALWAAAVLHLLAARVTAVRTGL
ncbi:MFS transporter [Streptomyces sp. S9]|nr:MFS transporter [Streptomyces sp. S9]